MFRRRSLAGRAISSGVLASGTRQDTLCAIMAWPLPHRTQGGGRAERSQEGKANAFVARQTHPHDRKSIRNRDGDLLSVTAVRELAGTESTHEAEPPLHHLSSISEGRPVLTTYAALRLPRGAARVPSCPHGNRSLSRPIGWTRTYAHCSRMANCGFKASRREESNVSASI